MFLDPTEIRLSAHVLLSDVMGCHSVYTYGYPNNITRSPEDMKKLLEGQHLFESLIEPLLEKYGPATFSYGFVSPALSNKIVRWKDPSLPSYHRWDAGAAVDVCFHISQPPIITAHEIDLEFAYSRMITYSESPFICLATRRNEEPRRAFYENRYMGQPTCPPRFITVGKNRKARMENLLKNGLPFPWEGSGYPTYHGGGKRQYHHRKVSRYTRVSDFLYNKYCVRDGVANNLPRIRQDRIKVEQNMVYAGEVIDAVLEQFKLNRVSIVRAYESALAPKRKFDWQKAFVMDLKFARPYDVLPEDVGDFLNTHPLIRGVSLLNDKLTLRVFGK